MNIWILLQIFLNVVFMAVFALLWFKLQRPPKDDPRLSRGLQLLQSKISILEDLIDRTDTQSSQLTALMEQKVKAVQEQIFQAERQISAIDNSMKKSLEVAKIFQDKIPHQEIIERQNTLKYVRAARMANKGASASDIAQAVDLSMGEIEFIAKVNRDQLQFSEADLPEWAKEAPEETSKKAMSSSMALEIENNTELPPIQKITLEQQSKNSQVALSELGEQFRKALNGTAVPGLQGSQEVSTDANVAKPKIDQESPQAKTVPFKRTGEIKKVVFPKIQINNNLG